MLYDQVSLLRAASEDGTFAISVTGDNTEVLFPSCMMYNVSMRHELWWGIWEMDTVGVTIYVIHSESFLLHQRHLPTSCSSFLHRALGGKKTMISIWFKSKVWGNTIFLTVNIAAFIWAKTAILWNIISI